MAGSDRDNNQVNNDNNQSNDLMNKILEFCKKNIRYISAGVVVVLLIIVLGVTAWKSGKTDKPDDTQQEEEQIKAGSDEGKKTDEGAFAVDTIPEINTLIGNYYTAYAAGNMDEIAKYAMPVTDTEKGYIGVFSQFVAGYENIKCYTKPGLAEGEYLVSVSLDMKFEGVETAAPGLDFFYIKKNENGYFIDNAYSQFNLQYKEQPLDSAVEERINSYIQEADVVELQTTVQNNYNTALSSDAALNTMAMETVPQAVKAWVATLTASGETGGDQQPDAPAEPPAETPAEPEAPADTPDQQPAVSEKVYANDNINIRKEPNESAEKAGSALKGDSFTRTGTTADGWSSIEYNGGTAYIKSDFLTTEVVQPDQTQAPEQNENSGLSYVPEGTTLTMNTGVNVRKSMNESSEKLGTTAVGDKVKVVLSYQEGWTKVEWNGKTGYIKTDLLLNN